MEVNVEQGNGRNYGLTCEDYEPLPENSQDIRRDGQVVTKCYWVEDHGMISVCEHSRE